jgi:hypothetical protein
MPPSPNPLESYNLEDRLAALDAALTLEVLQTAVQEHLAAYFSAAGQNYPTTFPPTAAWAECNRSLRDGLAPKWTAVSEKNQPLVVNEDQTIAITALSGDENTGTEETPSTRSPKGTATAEAVQINDAQSQFAFMEDPAAIAELSKVPGRSLWILLVHRDFRKREVRSELSKPVQMSEDGYISKWEQRIILPPISFDEAEYPGSEDDDNGGQSPEINVQITKL